MTFIRLPFPLLFLALLFAFPFALNDANDAAAFVGVTRQFNAINANPECFGIDARQSADSDGGDKIPGAFLITNHCDDAVILKAVTYPRRPDLDTFFPLTIYSPSLTQPKAFREWRAEYRLVPGASTACDDTADLPLPTALPPHDETHRYPWPALKIPCHDFHLQPGSSVGVYLAGNTDFEISGIVDDGGFFTHKNVKITGFLKLDGSL